MIKKDYNALELTVIAMEEDVIRTSDIFTSEASEAPDVYEPDPFIQN